MTAHVGDFGLARFLPNNVNSSAFLLNEASSSIGIKGSIGYAAPGKYQTLYYKFFISETNQLTLELLLQYDHFSI